MIVSVVLCIFSLINNLNKAQYQNTWFFKKDSSNTFNEYYLSDILNNDVLTKD